MQVTGVTESRRRQNAEINGEDSWPFHVYPTLRDVFNEYKVKTFITDRSGRIGVKRWKGWAWFAYIPEHDGYAWTGSTSGKGRGTTQHLVSET